MPDVRVAVHINVALIDLTPENGPIRQVPGTHRSRALSPHAQAICRYVLCDEGEAVIGEGFRHPRSSTQTPRVDHARPGTSVATVG